MKGRNWIPKKNIKLTKKQKKFVDYAIEDEVNASSVNYRGEWYVVFDTDKFFFNNFSNKGEEYGVTYGHLKGRISDALRKAKMDVSELKRIETRYGKYYLMFEDE